MSMKTVELKIEKLNGNINEIKKDICYIRKELEGNGSEGLRKETTKNSNFRVASEAKSKLITWFTGGGWAIAIIIVLLSRILNGG